MNAPSLSMPVAERVPPVAALVSVSSPPHKRQRTVNTRGITRQFTDENYDVPLSNNQFLTHPGQLPRANTFLKQGWLDCNGTGYKMPITMEQELTHADCVAW
jgi:hypothetical protein